MYDSRPALEGVDKIDAGAVVETLDVFTLIDINVAAFPAISRFAEAFKSVDAILAAGAVQTWVGRAIVDI